MTRRGLLLCCIGCSIGWSPVAGESVDPASTAATIDAHLERYHRESEIVPAPLSEDAEFLRRVSLDLIGHPPTVDEVRAFLVEEAPEKRTQLIDRLLDDPRHADHFARTWRALLLPEADSDAQLRYFQPGLEAWLRQKSLDRSGFDVVVRELLSVPLGGPNDPPQMVLRDLKQPNPVAFLASKGGDPATIAASATRLFLGVRLECAQCHNHPFESWTQQQFWQQAAFFAGVERRGRSPFSPLVEDRSRREIASMEHGPTVPATFLSGQIPAIAVDVSARTVWAEWVTSRENPRFAQAMVNRIWGQMLGAGFVDPVDDFGTGNPAAHPELLASLSQSFVEGDFQIRPLLAGICRSQAYQRTSRTTHASQTNDQQFARMAVKPMTGEQFFAVLSHAIDYVPQTNRLGAGRDEDPLRRRVLIEFATNGQFANPETSVSQALQLMNGSLTNNAGDQLEAEIATTVTDQAVLESLYLKTLSRLPTTEEAAAARDYLTAGDVTQRSRRFGDVLWALLNSAEFRWNH